MRPLQRVGGNKQHIAKSHQHAWKHQICVLMVHNGTLNRTNSAKASVVKATPAVGCCKQRTSILHAIHGLVSRPNYWHALLWVRNSNSSLHHPRHQARLLVVVVIMRHGPHFIRIWEHHRSAGVIQLRSHRRVHLLRKLAALVLRGVGHYKQHLNGAVVGSEEQAAHMRKAQLPA